MKKNSEHFRHLTFFFYQKGKTTSQTTKKICNVYGERAITESTVQRWYASFKSRDFELDTESLKSTYTTDESKIKIIVKENTKINIKKDNLEPFKITNLGYDWEKPVHDKLNKHFPVNPACGWLTKDPLYISYHNEEWGKPEFDGIRLFEMICLEGQQSGLSWLTILKKRDHYRKLFFDFNPYKIVQIKSNDIDKYLCDSGIVRHRSKIEAIVNNANCYINMENNGENFSEFIWRFVNNSPIINNWKNDSEVPIQTDISTSLSQALKKKGFKFVGATNCYAFMQACGLVNDHITSCYIRTAKS